MILNLIISHMLLFISLISLYNSWNNFFIMFLSIELSIFAIIILYLVFSIISGDIINQIFSLLILTTATVETVVGLSLLINFVNLKQDIQITNL